MKERHAIRAVVVLSYLLLVAGGKDARTTTQWENTSPFLMDRQTNKTIVVRISIHLIFFNYHCFHFLTSRENIKVDGRRRYL
jgi:hypothetical protein